MTSRALVNDRDMPVSAQEEEARSRLTSIFTGELGVILGSYWSGEALSILIKFPQLLLQSFYHGRLPISFFLQGQVERNILQVVLDLTEQCQTDIPGLYGIHDACNIYGADLDLIQFLLRYKKPWEPLNYVDSYYQKSPFQMVCEDDNKSPLQKMEVLKLFFGFRPCAILGDSYTPQPRNEIRFDEFLQRTSGCIYGVALMDFVFGEYQRRLLEREELGSLTLQVAALERTEAGMLNSLLPGLREFKLAAGRISEWEVGAWEDIIGAVVTNKTLEHLEIHTPSQVFQDGSLGRDTLQYALSKNETLQSITLNGDNWAAADDTPPISLDVAVCNASTLRLSYLGVNLNWSDSHPICSIQELHIQERLDAGLCAGLLSNLHQLPLRKLTIQQVGDPHAADVTVPLEASLGSHDGLLSHLAMCGLNLGVETLGRILRNNPELAWLAIVSVDKESESYALACVANHLVHHSASLDAVLTTYSDPSFEGEIPVEALKISYYAALNQDSRHARASSQHLSLQDFVGLLSDVAHSALERDVDWPMKRCGSDAKHNQQYGLLRIAPHVWSCI